MTRKQAIDCLRGGSGYANSGKGKAILMGADALDRIAALESELATDRARLAEAMANAERYLYIRTESLIHWKRGKKRNRISWPTIYAAERVDGGSYRDRFDAAIDAAMKGTV